MSKRSGEQARRSYIDALRNHPARYRRMMDARDKSRVVQALRCAANRLEGEAKAERALIETKAKAEGIAVTDHAVCRFLERVMGLDIDAVRDAIARAVPLHRLPPVDVGSGSHGIYVRDGFQFLLTPNSIISVLAPDMDGSNWLTQSESEALAEALQ